MGNTIDGLAEGLSAAKSPADVKTAVDKIKSEIFTNSQSRVDASNSTKVIPTIIDTINKKLIQRVSNNNNNNLSNEDKAMVRSSIATLWGTLLFLCDDLTNSTRYMAARSRCVSCGNAFVGALIWTMKNTLTAEDLSFVGDLLHFLFHFDPMPGELALVHFVSSLDFVEALGKVMQLVIGSSSTTGGGADHDDDGTDALLKTLRQIYRYTGVIRFLLDPKKNPKAQQVGSWFGKTKEIVFGLRNCFDAICCVVNGDQLTEQVKSNKEKMKNILSHQDEAYVGFLYAVEAIVRDPGALAFFTETDSSFVHGFVDLFTTAQEIKKRQTGPYNWNVYLKLRSTLQKARADKLFNDLSAALKLEDGNDSKKAATADKIIFELNFKIQNQESFHEAISGYPNAVALLDECLKVNETADKKSVEEIEETKQYIQNIVKCVNSDKPADNEDGQRSSLF